MLVSVKKGEVINKKGTRRIRYYTPDQHYLNLKEMKLLSEASDLKLNFASQFTAEERKEIRDKWLPKNKTENTEKYLVEEQSENLNKTIHTPVESKNEPTGLKDHFVDL
jgi:hypothetical protein